MTATIVFKSVSKSFGDNALISNADFEIKKGEFVFITGPTGSGKTTIIKMILAEILPNEGSVVVMGMDTKEVGEKDLPLFRQKIGVVFQDFKILPERTVRENVEVALAVVGVNEEDWPERVAQALKLTNILSKADMFPAQLSGGELQRVAFARALVVNPDIILADEPTGNLDWKASDAIMEILEKVHKEGKTVVMVTHNEHLIKKSKGKMIKIEGGKVSG